MRALRRAVRDPAEKIVSLDKLSEILRDRNAARVVQCHGVFDLLHVGHLRHLRQAAALGEILVVTVTPDRFVNKGPGRPVFTEGLRAEALASLEFVDYVAINRWPQAVETIRLLRPDVYAKGPDYRDPAKDVTGGISLEEAAVAEAGGKLVITEDITFSSSTLINRYLPVFPEDVRSYLDGFRRRYGVQDVLTYLERARSKRVLVVGETIIDEYQYCETMGKSAKEPILAARLLSAERFAGGVLAVANHLAGFCDQVGVLTMVGATSGEEAFIKSHVQPNVKLHALETREAPTIIKRRIVEGYLLQKLFEVYVMDELAIRPEEHVALQQRIQELTPDYDLVIAVDYGHGMIDSAGVEALTTNAPFLAVNTQSNAGNRGFNTISKYRRADYICLAQHEVNLETRNRRADVRTQIGEILRRIDCRQIMVTRGKEGVTAFRQGDGFADVPALTQHVVDRVGAGDAVLAISSLCVAQHAPMEVVGFVGNVVGSEAVTIVGNKESIQRPRLFKHIETLMK